MRCAYLADPIGIDDPAPAFGWVPEDGGRGVLQVAYQVLVASDPGLLVEGAADRWDSGRVADDVVTGVRYAGEPLRSRERRWWTVRL